MLKILEKQIILARQKKVADELEGYLWVFDVIKSISGAEPAASIAQGIFSLLGKKLGGFLKKKSMDIEFQKASVESALRNFNKRIVVFIDDMDRLFPEEVYEMIRIVKAVGDLPSITYITEPSYYRPYPFCAHLLAILQGQVAIL